MNDQKPKRGFAAMTPEKRREAGSKGGRAANDRGVTHRWNSDTAREAGTKGGAAVSADRDHMATIGRKGGTKKTAVMIEIERVERDQHHADHPDWPLPNHLVPEIGGDK